MGLAKPREDPRLTALLEQHGAILKRLNLKRRELERFNEESEGVRAQLAEYFAPIAEQTQSLDDEIHALFEKILKSPKRSKRRAREIEELYLDLQALGTISPRSEPDDADAQNPFAEDPGGYEGESEAPPTEAAPAESARDPHRGRGGDKRNFRALFLKLAAELHPDKVQDNHEKERRTELMKELNRAYRDGDIARILEIESTLSIASSEGSGLSSEDESERRCRVLESQNELLATQYKELLDDLLEARRSMVGEAVIEVRRNRRKRAANPYRTLIEPMEEFLEFLGGVRDHVESFVQNKISLEEFLDGPEMGDEIGDEIDGLVSIDGLISAAENDCDCPECTAMRELALLHLVEMTEGMMNPPAQRRPGRAKAGAKPTRQRQKAARKKNKKSRKK